VNSNASWLDVLEERYESAESGFRSALGPIRSLGVVPWEADVLRGIGLASLGLGKRPEARVALMSALEILASDPSPNAELTATLQYIAFATEPADVRPAARLAGAVAAMRHSGRLSEPLELDLRRRFEQRLIDGLGEDEWAREQAAGATLTLEEAIELGRALAAAPPETTVPSP
jgi:hypothetical protein